MSSSVLLALFLLVAGLVTVAISRSPVRRFVVLSLSLLFYALVDARSLWVLVGLVVIAFSCGLAIDQVRNQRRAWVVVIGVFGLVAVLATYRLGGPLEQAALRLSGGSAGSDSGTRWLLPAGLSFLVFRCVSYLIEVGRGGLRAERSLVGFAHFALFFPSLLMGPVTRAGRMLTQSREGRAPTGQDFLSGISVFLQGLTKKILIADRMAIAADQVLSRPDLFSPLSVWCGVLAYSLQIYCDFSGYSDMAIGAARVLGYDLPLNFDLPYLSRSIAEFWRRWHRSLSDWLRDYLFLPAAYRAGRALSSLGLPRLVEEHVVFAGAALATMGIAGLWHGAGWGFVLWGALHGMALSLHRVWWGVRGRRHPLPGWLAMALTYLFVTLAWVPFRSATLHDTAVVLSKLAFVRSGGYVWYPEWLLWCGFLVAAGLVVSRKAEDPKPSDRLLAVLAFFGLRIDERALAGRYVVAERLTIPGVYALSLWAAAFLVFAPTEASPFLYAQF